MFALDETTRWILGMPNNQCTRIAEALRANSCIDIKPEDEQAVVIYWMLKMFEKYGGDNWKSFAFGEIEENSAFDLDSTDPPPKNIFTQEELWGINASALDQLEFFYKGISEGVDIANAPFDKFVINKQDVAVLQSIIKKSAETR